MTAPLQNFDAKTLDNWLKSLPRDTPEQSAETQRVCTGLAHRAAMRALPAFEGVVGTRQDARVLLQVFRLLLISGVAAVCPSPEVKSAAAAAAEQTLIKAFAADALPTLKGIAPAITKARTVGDYAGAGEASRVAIAGFAANAALGAGALAGDADADASSSFVVAFIGLIEEDERKALEQDWLAAAHVRALEQRPLWPDHQDPQIRSWAAFANALREDRRGWEFWISWYEKCLAGEPQDWAGLLTDISVIPSDEWDKGPYHIAQLIDELRWQHDAAKAAPARNTINAVHSAVSINREPLHFQLNALVENLAHEMERLRGDNNLDPEVRDLLDELRRIAAKLQELLPSVGPADKETAGEMAALLGLYNAKLKEWPRLHADEVVDGTFRITLIGLSAGAFGLFGLPAWAGAALGGAVFGGTRLVEAAKNLRGTMSSGGS